jgi:hypothetical protein
MARKRILLIALCVFVVAASAGHSHAAPFFSGTSRQAVFLSPLERWMPTWRLESYKSLLEGAGYHVDVLLNGDVSISFLKSGLAKYDLIILRTDSMYREGLNYFCSGDEPNRATRVALAGEISLREVYVGVCVGFNMLFMRHYYPASSLQGGFVYVLASNSAELSSVFLKAGAASFVGYNEGQSIQWGQMDAYSLKLIYYLSRGYTVRDAVLQLYTYLHVGHGGTADWTMVYWAGDGAYQI